MTAERREQEVTDLLVTVSNISKKYGGVTAIGDASVNLYRGEVHALLGENGAGKSTLVNILAGNVRPDSGVITVKGKEVTIPNPRVSRAMGISVVHQHPVLFPDLTVAENIMFADGPPHNRVGLLDWKAVEENAQRAMQRLDIQLDSKALVKVLSSADQQLLEIAKALINDTDLLILDEPTAALSKREVASLMGVVRKLKADGVAILFVGHRLDEVFELADRITISRDGRTVVTGTTDEFTPETVISQMVGRTVENVFPKVEVELGPEHLRVKELSRRGKYSNVNFSVREGEILGLAGLVGAGRTEIAQGIFGLDPATGGDIFIGEKRVRIRSPHDAMKHGIAYVPEDRTREGVLLNQSVQFNLSLAVLDTLTRLGLIKGKSDEGISHTFIERLGIRTSGPAQDVSALSGGNQQKVVLGKWLATNPKILILDDPTRGVDVGAKSEVYNIVAGMAERGLTIILISNELEELLAVSDRVITFYRGEQGQEFTQRPFNAERVLASMTGQVGNDDA